MPTFTRNYKSNIISTRLPEFIDARGYEFGITKKRKLFLTISDEQGKHSYTSNDIIEKNICSHVAVVRKDSTLTFYINGVESGIHEDVKGKLLNPNVVFIGNGLSRFNAGFIGAMEYLRVWKNGFSPEVITPLVEEGTGVIFPNGAIKSFYNFTENEGQSYIDYVSGQATVSGFLPVGNWGDPLWRKMSAEDDCSFKGGRVAEFLKNIVQPEEHILESDITMYPNPFFDKIQIEGLNEAEGNLHISITSMDGKQFLSTVVHSTGKSIELHLLDLQPGFYVLTISNNKEVIATRKVIKLE